MQRSTRDESPLDALVVGAGPYGIATAWELHRRGLRFQVVGEPFALWHEHTLDVMNLRSDARASSLPGLSFPEHLAREGLDGAERVPVAVFRRYLHAVEVALPFPILRGRIDSLERSGVGFCGRGSRTERSEGIEDPALAADPIDLEATSVVLATGSGAHRHLPPSLAALGSTGASSREPTRLLHSWDTRQIQAIEDRDVLVVGGGQSAAETVAALRSANRVTWMLRRPPLFFREPLRAPTPVFKSLLALSPMLYRVPRPVMGGLQRLFFRTTITPDLRPIYDDPQVSTRFGDAEALGLVATADGIESPASGERWDLVVAATGFRYGLDGLPFLSPDLRRELAATDAADSVSLAPIDRSFESAVSGLYLAGGIAESALGPAQRFLLGSRHASRRIAASIARSSQGAPGERLRRAS